jgi:CheY-like chemotaxis protein
VLPVRSMPDLAASGGRPDVAREWSECGRRDPKMVTSVGTTGEIGPLATMSDGKSPATSGGHQTILVVDDEVDMGTALSEALVDAGYRVVLAANGRAGLELLPKLPKPLGVILDIIMPVMSGLELYQIMKATPTLADIPVLISTADPGRAPKGAPLIKKPVSLERLLAAVARLFGPAELRATAP